MQSHGEGLTNMGLGGGGEATELGPTEHAFAVLTLLTLLLNVAVVLDDNTEHLQAHLAYHPLRVPFAEI